MKHQPDDNLVAVPRWVLRVLVPEDVREQLLGDLYDLASERRRLLGADAARWAVRRELVRSVPGFLRMRAARVFARPPTAGMSAPARLEAADVQRAFSAFLKGPRRRPRWPVMFAVGCHGALLVGNLLWSAWQADELNPPAIHPILIAPPNPVQASMEPLPSAGGGSVVEKASRRARRPAGNRARPIPATAPTEVATAPTAPTDVDETPDAEDRDGTDGVTRMGTGSANGPAVGDGTCVGSSCPGTCSGSNCGGGGGSVVGPHVAEMQCLSCPPPELPPAFAQTSVRREVLTKICVSAQGTPTLVSLLRGADPSVDTGVLATVRTWRYRPYLVAGRPVPFCYVSRFIFEVH